MRWWRRIAPVAVLVTLASGCLHDIGTFHAPGKPDWAGRALDISDRNEVVGWAILPNNETPHAFITNLDGDGSLLDLTPLEPGGSVAEAINNVGMVAGTITANPTGAGPRIGARPFVWWGFTGLDVLPIPPGAVAAQAVDINDRGDVLVVGLKDSFNWQGSYVWNPAVRLYVTLPSLTPGAPTQPEALDERGGVVGGGLVWDPGTLAVHALRGGVGHDRNEHGVIVGDRNAGGFERQAVFWPDMNADPIDLPGGVEARAINDAGQIVGTRSTPATTPRWPYMAMMWEPLRGRTTELGDKQGRGSWPENVNAAGRSVGNAGDRGELDTAVWWDAPPA